MEGKLLSQVKQARIDLETALANSGVAISQQDLSLRYTQFVNTHPGIAQDDLIGKTDEDWLHPEEAAQLTAIKRKALKGQKGVRAMFKSTLNGGKEGDIYYNDIRVEPIWDKGKVVGIYTVAIDQTAFQKALMRLEKLNGTLLAHMEKIMDTHSDDPGPQEKIHSRKKP